MVKKLLDLFSGLGGFSQAFGEEWQVTTLDIEKRFDPDYEQNILNMTYEDFDDDYEVVLASPPCEGFSLAARNLHWQNNEPVSDTAKTGIQLVYHTLGLIKALNPDWWFMENPRGRMRHLIGEPVGYITLCQYGSNNMKPTDLWGEHPQSFRYRKCKKGQNCHDTVSKDKQTEGIQGTGYTAERAKLPYGLSEEVRRSVENPKGNKTSALQW